MEFLSPKVSAEDVAAEKRSFTSAPVEAGEYDMEIKTAPRVATSQAGNRYLQLMLTHTGDLRKGTTAVYPNFNLNNVGASQFRQLILALGMSIDDAANAQWGTEGETDAKGISAGVIAINGDPIDLTGKLVRVYLKKTTSEFNGKTTVKNEVGRFVIPS